MNEEMALQITETLPAELTVPELLARRKKIRGAVASIMQEDVHYGRIPGTPKPSLWQPGAEVLANLFQLEMRLEDVEDLSNLPDEVYYRFRVTLIHWPTRNVIGHGIGECSSAEEKYAWRAAVCPEEWEETFDDQRRKKWKKGYQGKPPQALLQIRTNPKDVANTILKMAAKRARVDAVKSTVGVSDMFSQDGEVPEEPAAETAKTEPEKAAPASSPPPAEAKETLGAAPEMFPDELIQLVQDAWHDKGVISEKQKSRLFGIAYGNGWNGDDIAHLIERSLDVRPDDLPWGGPYDLVVNYFETTAPETAE